MLITRDGRACLGDFGIADAFRGIIPHHWYKLGTLRYMAPERSGEVLLLARVTDPSKESDVYSLAMASFEVCSFVVNDSTTH